MSESSSKVYKIHVEYCGRWGYEPRYEDLAAQLQEAFGSSVSITGAVGRASSFEVTIDDKVTLWSKLEEGAFPDSGTLKASLASYMKDGKLTPIEKAKGCIIQ